MFKYPFILLLLLNIKVIAQTATPNIGFEDGTFNHWELSIGSVDAGGVVTVTPTNAVPDRFVIFSKELNSRQLDPNGNFPVVCPNGSKYSIRLGDLEPSSPDNGHAERATYTFTVPTNTAAYSVIFNYAAVLQNPNHTSLEQPKFTAQIFDITDNVYINCPSFVFVSGTALPGFKVIKAAASGGARGAPADTYYKDWSTATIDLHNYAGKQVRLEFTTNDCYPGGHFGYAYLDVNEDITYKPITGNTYCANQPNVTLYGPTGFAEYHWYKTGNFSTEIGTGQGLTMPSPPDGTGYTLRVIPYPELGCVDTLYTVVNRINSPFILKVADTVLGCTGVGANLTAAYVTAGSSDMTYTYFTNLLGTEYVHDPTAVLTPGTYYIRGINSDGCTDIMPVQVAIGLAPIKVTNPEAVVYPATVDITKTYVKQSKLTYSYFADAGATKPLSNAYTIDRSGTYYIQAENTLVGCTTISPVYVLINPPPPYTISAPNTFTPNNDGVNDFFAVQLDGFISFDNLKVFNRYGQLVFTTKSIDTKWDGNLNGHQLPNGTYYWVLEGVDQYYYTKVAKGGSITIIR